MKGAYFDISPEISGKTAVFPGDKVFSRQISMDFKSGQHLLLSDISTTVHIGAHADAPNHYHAEGQGIGDRDLFPYFGICQVVTAKAPRGARIEGLHLPAHFQISTPRILVRTLSFPNPNQWNDDFNSFSPELIAHWADQGVQLIGIDTPSVDPSQDKTLKSHKMIFEKNLSILEGLDLEKVPDGEYQLIALPLKLKDLDASPVRAILLPKGQDL